MTARRASRLAEVKWGEGEEGPILRRWMRLSPRVEGADRVIRSRPAQDFDYLVLDKRGFPLSWVEIKKRRVRFSDFGDALCPIRKHDYALALAKQYQIPFVMVVAYACGTLIEIDLAEPPAERCDIKRYDRQKAVEHGIWQAHQIVVIEREEAA